MPLFWTGPLLSDAGPDAQDRLRKLRHIHLHRVADTLFCGLFAKFITGSPSESNERKAVASGCGFPPQQTPPACRHRRRHPEGNHHGGGAGSQTALCDKFFAKATLSLCSCSCLTCASRASDQQPAASGGGSPPEGLQSLLCHR